MATMPPAAVPTRWKRSSRSGIGERFQIVGGGARRAAGIGGGAPVAAPVVGDHPVAGGAERRPLVLPDARAAGAGMEQHQRGARAAAVEIEQPRARHLDVPLAPGRRRRVARCAESGRAATAMRRPPGRSAARCQTRAALRADRAAIAVPVERSPSRADAGSSAALAPPSRSAALDSAACRRRRSRSLPLALVLALALVSPSAALAQPGPLAGFDAYVAQAVRDWKTPGLAIAVVKDGEVVFAKGYGVRRLGAPEPVDEHTLFADRLDDQGDDRGGARHARRRGQARLGRPGHQAPAVVRRSHDPYVTREVAGARSARPIGPVCPTPICCGTSRRPRPARSSRRLRDVPLESSLRTHFTYQNVMYAAAGEVVAAVSGMPWSEFVRTRIFAPLGMTGTIADRSHTRRDSPTSPRRTTRSTAR